VRLCFEPGAPLADEHTSAEKGHGRLVERTCRTSQLLHGYSLFPGIHQAVEVTRRVMHLKRGRVTKETTEVEYGVTSLSPRQAGAEKLTLLMRRHWHVENRNHHVRDDGWREDRQTWREPRIAYAMHVLLGLALNLLRTRSRHWRDEDAMVARAEAIDYLASVAPAALLGNAS
jgi:predicted transposase YbfD/YdcC